MCGRVLDYTTFTLRQQPLSTASDLIRSKCEWYKMALEVERRDSPAGQSVMVIFLFFLYISFQC